MICPSCKNQNLKSRVYCNGSVPAVAYIDNSYYDENGNYVSFPRPPMQIGYNCSNGHSFYA